MKECDLLLLAVLIYRVLCFDVNEYTQIWPWTSMVYILSAKVMEKLLIKVTFERYFIMFSIVYMSLHLLCIVYLCFKLPLLILVLRNTNYTLIYCCNYIKMFTNMLVITDINNAKFEGLIRIFCLVFPAAKNTVKLLEEDVTRELQQRNSVISYELDSKLMGIHDLSKIIINYLE